MTFSIVIPTYNGSEFIEEALTSVFNQTRLPDEIIVSDDNSTDNTLEIVGKYSDKLKIFRNEDGPSGFVNGWNKAIAHANSDYISILHQDDKLEPTFLEEIENAVKLNPDVQHLFVACKYIDENDNIVRTSYDTSGLIKRFKGSEYVKAYRGDGHGHIHRCPGVVTHKDIFKKCKYRAEAGHIADDDFFYRVGQYTEVIGVLKPLANYREHSHSETGHLESDNLVRRLLRDYDFQVRNLQYNSLFDNEMYSYFRYWKNKYLTRLFFYGLKKRKPQDISYAMSFLDIGPYIKDTFRRIRISALKIITRV